MNYRSYQFGAFENKTRYEISNVVKNRQLGFEISFKSSGNKASAHVDYRARSTYVSVN